MECHTVPSASQLDHSAPRKNRFLVLERLQTQKKLFWTYNGQFTVIFGNSGSIEPPPLREFFRCPRICNWTLESKATGKSQFSQTLRIFFIIVSQLSALERRDKFRVLSESRVLAKRYAASKDSGLKIAKFLKPNFSPSTLNLDFRVFLSLSQDLIKHFDGQQTDRPKSSKIFWLNLHQNFSNILAKQGFFGNNRFFTLNPNFLLFLTSCGSL